MLRNAWNASTRRRDVAAPFNEVRAYPPDTIILQRSHHGLQVFFDISARKVTPSHSFCDPLWLQRTTTPSLPASVPTQQWAMLLIKLRAATTTQKIITHTLRFLFSFFYMTIVGRSKISLFLLSNYYFRSPFVSSSSSSPLSSSLFIASSKERT